MNIEKPNNTSCTYQPFDSFSTTTLGCSEDDGFLIINKLTNKQTQKYINIFNELWNDKNNLENVTDKVLERIGTIYKENSPEFIYFFILFNVFNEFLEDLNEDTLPNERTGFKNTKIWNKLYDFQKDACIAIINKLEKFNGCILADSVGLGKTFTALAVIKYYELKNKKILVLCPKKLSDNWNTYKANYKNNPIADDRLNYDVLYHTDLSRTTGKSGEIDLSKVNWGNYDLVVIDESHNFRNGGQNYTDSNGNEKNNRYNFLMNKIMHEGIKTKVLMLSATPINNKFVDLRNQLALAYEGQEKQTNEKLGTNKKIDSIFKEAQAIFNKWSRLPIKERTTKQLLENLNFDFFELLDNVTIARSRKHIKEYYNSQDLGEFPERLAPINYSPKLSKMENTIEYKTIFDKLKKLNLSAYSPSYYILESRKEKYDNLSNPKSGVVFRQKDREKGTSYLIAINLLKRMESSVHSFNKTLEVIINKITSLIDKIENFRISGNDTGVDEENLDKSILYEEDIDTNISDKTISLRDIDYESWENDLLEDKKILTDLLKETEIITPEKDLKLQTLIEKIADKIEHPINPNNKKVLIFTAFADTAEYLYDNISEYMKNNFGLNTALVTGSIAGKNTIKNLHQDINTVLTFFSPISKEKHLLYPDRPENIDILIATDCISEGQNLQDCDYVINYDIHWNPVRIIQRFGRIDRIGSKNKKIQMVNFWADIELDEYIKLKERVEKKTKMVCLASSGDNNLIDDSEDDQELFYREQQLKTIKEKVIDIEDMDNGISIMDLGLNEFKFDLIEYIKRYTDIEKNSTGMNAVIRESENMPAGTIFILKNINNKNTNINNINRLHPFYMIYIKDNGEVVCDYLHPKELLDKLRFACKNKNKVDKEITAIFNKKTDDGRDMKHYSKLLNQAVKSIIATNNEKVIDSFFSNEILDNNITGLDDFELICFLVIEGGKE